MLDAVLVHPSAAVPHRRRQAEQRVEFVLPLLHQRLRREHQHRPVAGQRHELCRHRQLQGLAQPDLVGQHEARAVRPAMGVEGHLHEVLLVLPEPHFLAIDGRFDHHRGRFRLLPPAAHVPQQLAARQPIQVLNHEIGESHRVGRRPQRVEFLLNPRHRLWSVVLPDQLVVEAERRPGLVRAAEERRAPSVRQRNHAGLAVDQAECVIGQHANLDLAGPQPVVEPRQARLGGIAQLLGTRITPLPAHGNLGSPGNVHVLPREARVADQADRPGHALQSLARNFKDGRREVPGDAIVATGAGEPSVQEAGVERLSAGRVAIEHGVSGSTSMRCRRRRPAAKGTRRSTGNCYPRKMDSSLRATRDDNHTVRRNETFNRRKIVLS